VELALFEDLNRFKSLKNWKSIMIPSSYFFKIALNRKWEEPAHGESNTPEQDGPRKKVVRGFKGVAAFLRRVSALTDLAVSWAAARRLPRHASW
jgi:hypothetical protein